jgi:uncharacterized protein YecT (DUF1311 family)
MSLMSRTSFASRLLLRSISLRNSDSNSVALACPVSTISTYSIPVALGRFIAIAILLMAGLVAAPCSRAQGPTGSPSDQAPAQGIDAQPDAPPPPNQFVNTIPPDQLAFLKDYDGKSTKDLRKDKRFHKLMNEITPRTEYHYGYDMPLSTAVDETLGGPPLPVNVRDGRYVMAAANTNAFKGGKGFVWFDLQAGIGVGGVYFHPTNGEPTPTLAIYSRQIKATDLGISQFPEAFAQDLAQWSLVTGMRPVTVRYFIPDNGRKYVLLHDEDYCAHPEIAPARPSGGCEQLNADAADADMNGAYFMQETGNLANATAFMLGPDQVAWISFRTRTCGAGLACEIRVTRQRTRALIGQRR